MERIASAIIGVGYIGISHVEAIRRIGFSELVGVADTNRDLARDRAADYHIPKCYGTVEELLADPEVRVVHNCTPNNLHLEINEKIIRAGKHVFSEKPLGLNSAESGKMLALLEDRPDIVNAVNFNYRMNPMVQEMRHRVRNGDIGPPRLAHGSYLQDRLLFDTDYNWRLEPEISGPSRCIADIGSHWMDSVQVVTGAKIVEVCAALATIVPVRKKPARQSETFAVNAGGEYEEKAIATEDYGAVLFRMDNGARGVFYVSQVSAGRKCRLDFEIDGAGGSLYWNQEQADWLWAGYRDRDNSLSMRNPNLMAETGRQYTHLAAGHPEGWNDAFKNSIFAFYKFLAEGGVPGRDPADFATFADGHYIIRLTEAILESDKGRGWVAVS